MSSLIYIMVFLTFIFLFEESDSLCVYMDMLMSV